METIRLSQKAKEQLIWLKRQTGIRNWNVLCRWAFCISIATPGDIQTVQNTSDGNIEMSWKIFAGKYSNQYLAILHHWKKIHAHSNLDDIDCVRRHIHRGLSHLLSANEAQQGKLIKLIKQRA